MSNLIRIPGKMFVRTVLVLALALCTGVGLAHAGNAPLIDGNGDDIIALAASIGAAGCGVDRTDARDDISITDPEIIVCGTKEDTNGDAELDYFINGFDLRRFVFVYDRTTDSAYILWRTEGKIGDVDGNGNPDDAICPPTIPSFGDEPGIGSQENYQVRIDTNCDNLPDITITVGGTGTDNVSVVGASIGGSDLEYRAGAGTGNDLELALTDIDLPVVFRVSANTNASFDGLGEDISPTSECGVANPSIDIEKSVLPASICPGQTADFTLVVTNTGNVDLTNVTVVDNLPAPLDFVSTVSNTCGGPVNQVGDQITYGPFNLAEGASCTIVIRVSRTAECQGEQTNVASVDGTFSSPCVNGGQPIVVTDEDSATLLCGNIECSIDAPDTRVCGTETVEICGPVGDFSYLWSTGATTRCITVGAGTYSLVITDNQSGCVSTNPCQVTIVQDTPQIEVDKSVSPSGSVDQGTLLTYTIVVTNPAKSTVTVDNIIVRDFLCDEVTYQNNASPTPTSEPNVGDIGGTIVWNLGSLAPGNSVTLTFDARVRELPSPECEATNRECTNRVEVSAFCGDNEATDSDEVDTPINPCLAPGLCRLTGGGCLNEDGDQRGHKQSTFGGNSSPAHEGGGPTGNEWTHVYRDGREILFNWHSHDAHVIECSVVEPGPCHPSAENTRADFVGTGLYSDGSGGREFEGNMVAYIIDHREGACNRNDRDEYSIIIREGLVIGEGDIVFQTSGEIDCGNLQIHETPPRLFGNGVAPAPGSQVGAVEGVALLNKAIPNPFSGSMSYAYEVVGQDQQVDIGVYNVAGRLVKSLTKASMPVGRYTVSWNGTDDAGVKVSGGVYFVRVRLGGESQQHRVIFLGQ